MKKISMILGIASLSFACAKNKSYTWLHDHVKNMAVETTYKITEGDVIGIYVWNQEKLSGKQEVRKDGRISMPLLGDIDIGGLSIEQAASKIKMQLSTMITNPDISIYLVQNKDIDISVIGKVNAPGFYKLPSGSGVIDAIAISKGLNDFASKDKIYILRKIPKSEKFRVTYKELVHKSEDMGKFALRSGDAIVVQ